MPLKDEEHKQSKSKRISRRNFFKYANEIALGLTIGGYLIPRKASSQALNPKPMDKVQRQNNFIPVIDVHAHCTPQANSKLEKRMRSLMMSLRVHTHQDRQVVKVKGISCVMYPELMDIDLQMQGRIESGVTKSLISYSMLLETMAGDLPMPDKKVIEGFNDAMAKMAAKYPDKLNFMAHINPFQKGAVKECERCFKNLGAKGISIGTSWQGEFLDSPKAEPLWEFAQDQDQAIFIHPPFAPIGYQKMDIYKLEEMVGRAFDTTMTLARMIYSGVFDRYPRLKIVVPHMGGALPNVIGRLDFGYRLGYQGLPQAQAAVCKRRPSDYLRTNLYVDTMGFSAETLKHCIELFGIDRIVFGSDYGPVPISPKEHIELVKNLGLNREDEEKIFWRNANQLFKII